MSLGAFILQPLNLFVLNDPESVAIGSALSSLNGRFG